MRILFVATSSYSLLNVIQAVKHKIYGNNTLSTLFLFKRGESLENVDLEKLKEYFECVYVFDCLDQVGFLKKVRILIFGFPSLKSELQYGPVKEVDLHFDMVVSPSLLYASLLGELNKTKNVSLIEEGLSSYTGRVVDSKKRSTSYFFYKILSRLINRTNTIRSIALYSPSLFVFNDEVRLIQIPSFSSGDIKTCLPIFNVTNTQPLKGRKIFLIGQAFWGVQRLLVDPDKGTGNFIEKCHEIYKEVFSHFSDSVNRLIFRPHPIEVLDNDFHSYEFTLDDMDSNWELTTACRIRENDVVINFFSTVGVTSSLLFGREPIVIFLYRIFNQDFYNADLFVTRLKATYSDPGKILTPSSIDELREILAGLEG